MSDSLEPAPADGVAAYASGIAFALSNGSADAQASGSGQRTVVYGAMSTASASSDGLDAEVVNDQGLLVQPALPTDELLGTHTFATGSGLESSDTNTYPNRQNTSRYGRAAVSAPDDSERTATEHTVESAVGHAHGLRGTASARWRPDACLTGQALSRGSGAATSLSLAGVAATGGDGALESLSTTAVTAQVDENGLPLGPGHGITATAEHTFAPVRLLPGTPDELGITILGTWQLQATAGGVPDSAFVRYGPRTPDPGAPVVVITQGPERRPLAQVTWDDIADGNAVNIAANAGLLTVGAPPTMLRNRFLPPRKAGDGTEAAAMVDIVTVDPTPGSLGFHGVHLGHMEVEASAPAGGLTCGDAPPPPEPIDVLVFSGCYGFCHPSIKKAEQKTLADLAARSEVDFTVVQDAAAVTQAALDQADALLFLNATGNAPFSPEQRRAIIDFVRRDGHGFVGVHASADGHYDWPELGEMQGAYFDIFHFHLYGHGPVKFEVEDTTNPIVSHYRNFYSRDGEDYRLGPNPRPNVHVLHSIVNESAPEGALFDHRQPMTWCQPYGEGRSFYTNFGHAIEEWDFPEFQHMLLQGIRWSARRLEADCSPATDRTGRLQASWAEFDGARVATSSEAGAQATLTEITPDSWVRFDNVGLTGVRTLDVHASPETEPARFSGLQPRFTPAAGGTVTARLDAVDGPVLGSVAVEGPPRWVTYPIAISEVEGVHDIVLTFEPSPAATIAGQPLLSLAWLRPAS